jgi:ankyrin repeat protein
LLNAGADLKIRNKRGEIAFDLAQREQHREAMTLLQRAGL